MNYFDIDLPSFSKLKPLFSGKDEDQKIIDFLISLKKPFEFTPALTEGTAVHSIALEKKDTTIHFVSSFESFRTKEAKAERDAFFYKFLAPLTPLEQETSFEEMCKLGDKLGYSFVVDNCNDPNKNRLKIIGDVDAVFENPYFSSVLKSPSTKTELAFFGKVFGLEMKGKVDIFAMKYKLIADLKTMRGGVITDNSALTKQIETYCMPEQLMVYRLLAAYNGHKIDKLQTFAVDKACHATRLIDYPKDFFDQIEYKIEQGIKLYQRIKKDKIQLQEKLTDFGWQPSFFYLNQ
jgi:hypothetical protein